MKKTMHHTFSESYEHPQLAESQPHEQRRMKKHKRHHYSERNPQLPPSQPRSYSPAIEYTKTRQPQRGQTLTILPLSGFGLNPKLLTCPHCGLGITTRVEIEATSNSDRWGVILCLFGVPCCCIPVCTTPCKDHNHYCPSCGAFLGSYSSG